MTFPPDYFSARRRFRDAAAGLGWTGSSCSVGPVGPQREDLTIDVAISTGTDSEQVLILSSGLHGVEGHFGSAVQLALMERWRQSKPPPGVRCVLIHALNPYGYAWSRRCDAENIDPNRNFLPAGAPFAGSPEHYAEVDPWLNPMRPPTRWDLFYPRALWAIARHGRPALERTLVVGQHDFPKGLFFGGHGPSRTQLIVREHLRSWIGGANNVVHLDLHTGLGPSGMCQLLVDYPLSLAEREQLTKHFGPDAYRETGARGGVYQAAGSFGPWCVRERYAPHYLFAFAEFGTYGGLAVIAGLRRENQAHHWSRPGDPATTRAGMRLRELFCPRSGAWRARVLENGLDLVGRAIAALRDRAPT